MTTWTAPADLERRLGRRWQSGEFLRRWAAGQPWEPLGIPLRGPAPGDLAADLPAARRWVASWERVPHIRLERKRVGGRLIGANELPARAWIDSYRQLWSVLAVTAQVDAFDALLADTRRRAPRLVEWLLAHPLGALDLEPIWAAVVATVLWIDALRGDPVYVRQVDVPGVDTKFIEQHRGVLAALLDLQLAPDRIDATRPRSEFIARYGFRSPPRYLRLRTLDPRLPLPGGYSELLVRREEVAAAPPVHLTVHVIENQTTYLAFPSVPSAVAIFGEGYAVAVLEAQRWLADRRLVYSGDIDTHGFAILDRLRQRFSHTESLLMDRATLLAHESQWVREPDPIATLLAHLRPDETDLYRDLVEDTFGTAVRLEQERISYRALERAAQPT